MWDLGCKVCVKKPEDTKHAPPSGGLPAEVDLRVRGIFCILEEPEVSQVLYIDDLAFQVIRFRVENGYLVSQVEETVVVFEKYVCHRDAVCKKPDELARQLFLQNWLFIGFEVGLEVDLAVVLIESP